MRPLVLDLFLKGRKGLHMLETPSPRTCPNHHPRTLLVRDGLQQRRRTSDVPPKQESVLLVFPFTANVVLKPLKLDLLILL